MTLSRPNYPRLPATAARWARCRHPETSRRYARAREPLADAVQVGEQQTDQPLLRHRLPRLSHPGGERRVPWARRGQPAQWLGIPPATTHVAAADVGVTVMF